MMLVSKVLFTVRWITPSVSAIEIRGDLNHSVEKQLLEAFEQARSPQASTILLDFQNLDFINSSGIGLLITLLIRAKRLELRLAACGLSPHFQKIFGLTRLQEAIPVFTDEAAAMASLNAAA